MKDYYWDHGTPEEEAMRWRVLPLFYRLPRIRETYPYTVGYYDKPEGEDLMGKITAINRHVLPFATVWGAMDCLMITNHNSVLERVGRALHFMWPAAGAATAYATATYASTKLRGKDDL